MGKNGFVIFWRQSNNTDNYYYYDEDKNGGRSDAREKEQLYHEL